MTDKQRLETLKQGLVPAGENGFVSIASRDLRWLIELVESSHDLQPVFDTFDEPKEEKPE